MNKVLRLISNDLDQLKNNATLAKVEKNDIVFVLCAAWCGTCATFQATMNELAKMFVNATFIWLDVEDDDAVAGDVDVANFPTLAVFRQGTPVHYGVSLPHQGVVKRLLNALLTNPIHDANVPQEVALLPQKLQEWLDKN